MIEILLLIATSFVAGLSGALVPGPMLTVTISDSVKKGFIAGPLVVLGHFIAEITLIFIIMAGFSWLIGSTTAAMIIGTLGGIMLIYMGYNNSKSSNKLLNIQKDGLSQRYGSVFGGIITSISNPYFFIWWATIGMAFMFKGLEIAGIIGLLGFLIGHWSADMSWYSTVSFLTSKGSEIMTDEHYDMIMKICGIFLIILGIYFLITAQLSNIVSLF
ncbi:MAG: LysE type translocator [Methanobacterium sp. PtaU1.Bin242]|nr:MAG: LysE type translocator [Methanobacterium sp. PtaU1.Bin242]